MLSRNYNRYFKKEIQNGFKDLNESDKQKVILESLRNEIKTIVSYTAYVITWIASLLIIFSFIKWFLTLQWS